VLHRDVLVLQPGGVLLGEDEKLRKPLGEVDLPRLDAGAGDPAPSGELPLHFLSDFLRVGAHSGQQPGDQPALLAQERKQQVFPVDLGVPHGHGDVLGAR
jgi:hypothetical protein